MRRTYRQPSRRSARSPAPAPPTSCSPSRRYGIVDLEVAPNALYRIDGDGSCLVHANHFRAPASLGIVETDSEENSRSCERQARFEELLAGKPQVSIRDLQSFLADHQGFPHGVCYHVGEDDAPDERFATVAAFVMDLDARTMSVADGPACEREFVEVSL